MDFENDSYVPGSSSRSQRRSQLHSASSPLQTRAIQHSRIEKRARIHHVASRPLSVARIAEIMDKAGLENLISTLCNSHPELAHEVAVLAPKITINSALNTLNKKLDAVFLALPYKGDQQGDYAYLRVKSVLEDLLMAMNDYMRHFLPPNEQQISNSLAFLDSATSLLHKVPEWTNPVNNYAKNSMYDEVSQAWMLTLVEAASRESNNGLGLAYRGWEQKLEQHNAVANNKLSDVLKYLCQAMTWRDAGESKSPSHGLTNAFSQAMSPVGVKHSWNH